MQSMSAGLRGKAAKAGARQLSPCEAHTEVQLWPAKEAYTQLAPLQGPPGGIEVPGGCSAATRSSAGRVRGSACTSPPAAAHSCWPPHWKSHVGAPSQAP